MYHSSALRDEIEAANERFTEAFNRQDASTLAGFYTEDCTLMATGSDVVQGRESKFLPNYYLCPAKVHISF